MNPTLLSSGPAVYPDWDDAVADLGDRVRAERKARGWTQQQLAERCGLNTHQIKHVEAGATSIRNYLAACWGLGVGLADLLSDRWRMPEPRTRLTPMQARVVREAVSGDRLPVIAARIGTTRQVVGARLSEAYRLLGVSHLPVRERRAAAVRVAMKQGLIGEALASRTA